MTCPADKAALVSGKIFEYRQPMKKLLLLVAVFGALQTMAQDAVTDSNTVIVRKDPRLDLLVRKQAQINELTTRDARRTAKGFRLIVISTNSREEAIAAKAKVYTYFPELKAYMWHQSPYYRVKAGNFKDRKEAEDYRKKMNDLFPKGVFIMNDIIEVKPEKMLGDD